MLDSAAGAASLTETSGMAANVTGDRAIASVINKTGS
jgi:acyl-coenzyme A thioesterase PaaI-like protein